MGGLSSCMSQAVHAAATTYRFLVIVMKCLIYIETGCEGPSINSILNLLQDRIVFHVVGFISFVPLSLIEVCCQVLAWPVAGWHCGIVDNAFSVLISAACCLVTCFLLLNDASLIFETSGPFKVCFALRGGCSQITSLRLIRLPPEQKHQAVGTAAPYGGGVWLVLHHILL